MAIPTSILVINKPTPRGGKRQTGFRSRTRTRIPLPQVCLCVEERTIRFMTTTGINVSPPLLCTWWSPSAAKSISVGYSQKSPEKSIHYGEITTVTRITRYRNPADHSSELLISQEWEVRRYRSIFLQPFTPNQQQSDTCKSRSFRF